MPVSVGKAADGRPVILIAPSGAGGGNTTLDPLTVQVELAPPLTEADLTRVVSSSAFSFWTNSYAPRSQRRLILEKLEILRIEEPEPAKSGTTSTAVELRATVRRGDGPGATTFEEKLYLSGLSAAVLVILRVNSTTPSRRESRDGYRENPRNENGEGRPEGRPREYVLFVKRPRAAVGAPEHREVIHGHMNQEGFLEGEAAREVEILCGLRFHESHLDDLTSLALSAYRSPCRCFGVSVAPDRSDERVRLFLYRETVTRAAIEQLLDRSAASPANGQIAIDLWALSDAWRLSTDARTLAALFLFHELRYYGLMPRYRPRRDGARFQLRRAPVYGNIGDLDPNVRGGNLRVRVVGPARNVPRTSGRHYFIVGDGTGVVRLALDNRQIAQLGGSPSTGAPLLLRNVQYDMSGGHVTISIDRFGKVATPDPSDLKDFDFIPNMDVDISAMEYERVEEPEVVPQQTQQLRGSRRDRRPRP